VLQKIHSPNAETRDGGGLPRRDRPKRKEHIIEGRRPDKLLDRPQINQLPSLSKDI